jgi:ATP synthase protein I
MNSDPESDLGKRIAAAQAEQAKKERARQKRTAETEGSMSAGAYALRYGSELVACVFVGGLLGFWADKFFQSAPWGLLIGGALGMAAGFRAVMRAYRELNERAKAFPPARDLPPEDDKDQDR